MSLRGLLLAALTYVLVLPVIAFVIPLSHVLDERIQREVRTQARSEAALTGVVAVDVLGASTPSTSGTRLLRRVVTEAARLTRGRVIVVGGDGELVADSARPGAAIGASYGSRPEIKAGLAGQPVQVQRDSVTLGHPLLVTGEPVRAASGRVIGVVRVSQDVGAISRAIWRGRAALLGLLGLVLALGFGVALLLARRLASPLASLERTAHAVADGDMTATAPEVGSREQVAVAQAFNTMTSRLDRTLTAQQHFVANASHQLRTPLTGVRLRIEEARFDAAPQAAEHLDAATAEVDRLAATIADLLVLSRTDERPQVARPVDLAALASDVAERVRPTAAEHGREVRVTLDQPSTFLAGRADLERILDVFLENALAYGAGPIDLVVRGARIEVSDRGPGLAPGENDGRLFERFQRGSAGRAAHGTGLGLAIASTLAARWGAAVGLVPRDGGGATAFLDGSAGTA